MSRFFGNEGKANNTNTTTNTGWAVEQPSEAQVKWYEDLCKLHRIEVQQGLNKKQMSDLINKYRQLPLPASDKQIEIITKKLETLTSFGLDLDSKIDILSVETLTGGKDGTASKYIQYLIDVEREYYPLAQVSERQLDVLIQMYLCPDVEWAGIVTKVNEDKSTTDYPYSVQTKVPMGEFWRKMTEEEFEVELKEKLTRLTASHIIEKFRPAHQEWQRQRATIEQRKHIMELEERLQGKFKLRTFEECVDEEGNKFQIAKSKGEKPVREYTPMSELEIYLMSQEQATQFINRLKYEISQTDLYRFGETSDGSETFEELREERNKYGEIKSEEDKFADFIFKLEANLGYELTELHNQTANFQEELKDLLKISILEGRLTASEIIEMMDGNSALFSMLL